MMQTPHPWAQAAKRVAVRFVIEDTISWDHSKLGGAY